jgi:aspartyl-tRNA(Asn)/glutamyl-tRNA(Gln) amidotransferase subunit B
VHLEEDAGKLVHQGAAGLKGSTSSLVDLNRTGVPLMEIVSEPDIRSPEEARVYMEELRKILVYLGVCDGNMEEGSLRCDANISLRPVGQKEFGVKTEVKNMNSFKAVEKALIVEVKRQTELLDGGGKVVQETRLFDEATGTTISMRGKEQAHDYRYFPEPDLVPIEIDGKWIDDIKKTITELPQAKRARYASEFKLPEIDAVILTADKALAEFFEESVKLLNEPKEICNWMMGDLLAYLNDRKLSIKEANIIPASLIELIKLVSKGTISRKTGKEVLVKALETGKSMNDIISESGATQISNEGELAKVAAEVVAANPAQVAQYKGGKTTVLAFFVGQAMKATKGRANPAVLNQLILKELSK